MSATPIGRRSTSSMMSRENVDVTAVEPVGDFLGAAGAPGLPGAPRPNWVLPRREAAE